MLNTALDETASGGCDRDEAPWRAALRASSSQYRGLDRERRNQQMGRRGVSRVRIAACPLDRSNECEQHIETLRLQEWEGKMPRSFILNAVAAPRVAPGKSFYSTFDEALRGARFRLGNGAVLAWVIDRDGNLVLTADQVAERLKSEELTRTR